MYMLQCYMPGGNTLQCTVHSVYTVAHVMMCIAEILIGTSALGTLYDVNKKLD